MAQTTTPETLPTWEIDAGHSHIEFSARHMMVTTVKGRFAGVQGTLRVAEDHAERSEIEVTIDAASVDTRNEQRDNHLRSADFLDVERFPRITFRSKHVEPRGDNRYRVVGDLTIRDVTREVALDATFQGRSKAPWGAEVAGFSAQTTVNRKDFGLMWNVALEAGGFLVGDEVHIALEVEAVKRG